MKIPGQRLREVHWTFEFGPQLIARGWCYLLELGGYYLLKLDGGAVGEHLGSIRSDGG